MCHLTAKSEFRTPKGSASQVSAAAGSQSRGETVQREPFQDTSHPESTCVPSDISHLDTHTPTTRSRAVSVNVKFRRFRPPSSSCQIVEGDNGVKRHCGEKV